jgi:excisionase family DNA binding protein
MEGKFFTVKELSTKLNVCQHTIRRAIRSGRIHAFRPGIGKKAPYRIYESELTRIIMLDFETIKREKENESG